MAEVVVSAAWTTSKDLPLNVALHSLSDRKYRLSTEVHCLAPASTLNDACKQCWS